MSEQLGDGPIDPALVAGMTRVANVIDGVFNPPGRPRQTGFVLMAFPFNDFDGRCNYVSNAAREDIVVLLKEQLARFEGMPEPKGAGGEPH